MALKMAEIRAAKDCPKWREFKVFLKQFDPDKKMFWLLEYLKPQDWKQNAETDYNTMVVKRCKGCCDYDKRAVQAICYMVNLTRTRGMDVVPPRYQFKTAIQEYLEARVRRRVRL